MDIVLVIALALLLFLGYGCAREILQRRGLPRDLGPSFLKLLFGIGIAVLLGFLAS
ncbi:MAG: hypothetical protein WB622_14455 [Acidobacteriaceae bacterium]